METWRLLEVARREGETPVENDRSFLLARCSSWWKKRGTSSTWFTRYRSLGNEKEGPVSRVHLARRGSF